MTEPTFDELAPGYTDDDENPFEEIGAAAVNQVRVDGASYYLPHPLTGKQTRFTRASGWGSTIADETILSHWRTAMTALTISKNRDLYALANSIPMPEEEMEYRPKGWWMPWYDVAIKGWDRDKADSGSHLGTAFHAWREQYEAGTISLRDIPEEWRPHMEAFIRMHKASALTYQPNYVEQIVLTLKIHNGIAGRFDNLRRGPSGWLMVDDTKTGKEAPEGMDEIAIQLAIYANAEWHYRPSDPEANTWGWVHAPENIRKDVATITWVPINAPEKAQIIPINIADGWIAAQVVGAARRYRNKSKRKNNGLRLPLSVLSEIDEVGYWSDQQPMKVINDFVNKEILPVPVNVPEIGYLRRIQACTTAEELSAAYLDALAVDKLTPAVQKASEIRLQQIKEEKSS